MMKYKKIIKSIAGGFLKIEYFKKFWVLLILGSSALFLIGCAQNSRAYSEDIQSPSDSGSSEQSPSDAGGEINEADDLIPESVKAIKEPNKDDYPGWDAPGINGAEPLTKFFADSLMYAFSTGNTALVEELYDPDKCSKCEDIVQKIHKLDSEKVYFDHGFAQEAIELEVIDFDEDTKNVLVYYKYILTEYSEYEAGEFVRKYDDRLFNFYLQLHDLGDRWEIINVGYDSDAVSEN